MTEKETMMILAILKQNYKNAKIEDPKAEVNMWLAELGQYPADVVKVATQFHIARSDFWPTIEAIKKLIPRAQTLVQFEKANSEPQKKLEAPKRAKVTAIPDGMTEDEWLDAIIQDQIDLETEMYGDDNDDNNTAGFLPYEK